MEVKNEHDDVDLSRPGVRCKRRGVRLAAGPPSQGNDPEENAVLVVEPA
jgi:hypothetical protein